MSQPARVLIASDQRVEIEPPSDRLVQPTGGESRENGLDPGEFTHQAYATNCRKVRSEAVLRALDNSSDDEVLVFPLAGYEWLNELSGSLNQTFPLLWHYSIVVGPTSAEPGNQPSSPESMGFHGSRCRLRLVCAGEPAGEPQQPFVLPQLAPGARLPDGKTRSFPSSFDPDPALTQAGSAYAVCAGLAQIDDNLDASHTLAQSIEGHPDGDYWHAIMHRREPDYDNSKYWFRHVGRHPVFAELASRAAEILNDAPSDIVREWSGRLKVDAGWDPFAFVDMCQQAASDEDSDLGLTARRIQWIEMLLLLKHCARAP